MPCRKQHFRDALAAKLALAGIRWSGKSNRAKTENRTYRCPECSAWHLTSKRR